MKIVSYMDFRLDVLDDFYLCLVQNKNSLSYEEVLYQVSYNFESGFSDIEVFLVDFILYILCNGLKSTHNFAEKLEKNLFKTVNSEFFRSLLRQIIEKDRGNLLHDLYLAKLITKEKWDNVLKN